MSYSSMQICSHVNRFQDGVEAPSDAVFSFIPQPKSHENKQVTIVLRIRINKYFELFCSSESNDKTSALAELSSVSVAVAMFFS